VNETEDREGNSLAIGGYRPAEFNEAQRVSGNSRLISKFGVSFKGKLKIDQGSGWSSKSKWEDLEELSLVDNLEATEHL